ncbi:hypothetical protein [Hafnia alvei]|nr:hypothetical protein [Hafnia alvei]
MTLQQRVKAFKKKIQGLKQPFSEKGWGIQLSRNAIFKGIDETH